MSEKKAPSEQGAGPGEPSKTTYKVDDQELLLGFYKRILWDWLVPRIPHAITPNALTIGGQLMALFGALVCGLATQGHTGLYFVSALMFLAYLTADNVDGPHARRTGRSSPLGEFLDHGLDGSASAALLLATTFMLQLDGVMMATMCAIAGLGFTAVFWEQFRTGVLIIPKVSTTEGVSLLAVCLMVIAFTGEPTWMHFSFEVITPGTILVLAILVGYAAACLPPVVRTARAGKSPLELVPVLIVTVGQTLFAVLGSNGIAPAIGAGLVAGDVTCRIIVLRHRGQHGPIMSPILWLTLVPLALAAALPDVWHPTGWAIVAMGIIIVSYLVGLVRGGRELLERARQSAGAARS